MSPTRALLVVVGLMLLQGGIGATLVATSGGQPDLTLTSDAGGVPLFTATGMTPGRPVTRCLRLDYAGAVDGDQLKLSSRSSGPLAGHLLVGIDVGTGGGATTCSGFTGTALYSGTLQDLSAAHGSELTALLLRKLSSGSDAVTVRMRVAVDDADADAVQGTSATSDLLWIADPLGNRSAPPPVVTPIDPVPAPAPPGTPHPPAPVPVPVSRIPAPPTVPALPTSAGIPTGAGLPSDPALPTSAGIPTSADQPTGSGGNSGSGNSGSGDSGSTAPAVPTAPTDAGSGAQDPVGTTVPAGAATPPGTPSPAPAGRSSGPLSAVGNVFGSGARAVTSGVKAIASAAGALAHVVTSQVIAPVAAAAAPAAKGAGFGLGGTAPLLGAFLLIQDRIDRRDPKLALAPTYADPDLTFDDTPRGPMTPPTSSPGEPPGSDA